MRRVFLKYIFWLFCQDCYPVFEWTNLSIYFILFSGPIEYFPPFLLDCRIVGLWDCNMMRLFLTQIWNKQRFHFKWIIQGILRLNPNPGVVYLEVSYYENAPHPTRLVFLFTYQMGTPQMFVFIIIERPPQGLLVNRHRNNMDQIFLSWL